MTGQANAGAPVDKGSPVDFWRKTRALGMRGDSKNESELMRTGYEDALAGKDNAFPDVTPYANGYANGLRARKSKAAKAIPDAEAIPEAITSEGTEEAASALTADVESAGADADADAETGAPARAETREGARVTIRYYDASGFDCILTVPEGADVDGIEAAIKLASYASARLLREGASVRPPYAKPPEDAEDAEDEDEDEAAPVCPVHNVPMLPSKYHSGFYCPKTAASAEDDNGKGYCVYAAREDGTVYRERAKDAPPVRPKMKIRTRK